jgi:hypothetical protein
MPSLSNNSLSSLLKLPLRPKFERISGQTHSILLKIGMALEEQFNLSFPDDEMDKISTVGDLYEALAIFLERMEPRK